MRTYRGQEVSKGVYHWIAALEKENSELRAELLQMKIFGRTWDGYWVRVMPDILRGEIVQSLKNHKIFSNSDAEFVRIAEDVLRRLDVPECVLAREAGKP